MTLKNGLIGGFAGSAVLAVFFVVKSMMWLMPQMDIIMMLSAMMGMPAITGWVAHFAIGTIVWGGLFSLANGSIPGGAQISKGVVLGLVAWLIMMVVVMPMAGAGIFGLNMGMMGAVLPLMLHIIFGLVLGYIASSLGQEKSAAA